MYFYSNSFPMQVSFKEAIDDFIAQARTEGCTSTDEEIFAAWEVIIMDSLGVPVPARTRRLAQNFQNEINGVFDGTVALN